VIVTQCLISNGSCGTSHGGGYLHRRAISPPA
jgi:hypothetical protein